MNLGIFLPNWIGDVAMATPTLRALRKHYGPAARIVGIMRPYVSEVLVGTSWLDDRIFFDPRSKNRDLHGWRFARRLRAERFDTVVLLTNSLRTAFWAWLSGAPQRVGYARDVRAKFLTHKLFAPMAGGEYAPQSTLDAYLRLAYAMGCPLESTRMELATTAADEQAADDVWRKLEIPADRPVVLLNSGAAFGASKLWPAEHFGDLARRIAADWGYTVLAICGPRERDIVRQIVARAAHPLVKSLADPRLGDQYPLPIGLSKACVRRASLMVTTDSGPRHFAPAFNVPVITLFGPTHISLSETHFPRAVHLQHKVPCGPCMQQKCPLLHHECMQGLSVDRVYRAVQAQLTALESGTNTDWDESDPTDVSGPLVIPVPTWRGGATSATAVAGTRTQPRAAGPHWRLAAQTLAEDEEASETQALPDIDSIPRPAVGNAQLWINEHYREALADAGLDNFAAIMATTDGRLMRALPDRENWRITLRTPAGRQKGAFLKKHHLQSLGLRMRAATSGTLPTTSGRVEAENILRLERAGIRSMTVIAFGEKLHPGGLLESFVLTEELAGYTQLDQYLRARFPLFNTAEFAGRERDGDFVRLLAQVADIARRFHGLGFNHRDLYACHFFVRENDARNCDVRLIDLQRVQHRTRLRGRWIVKDLAQLAYSAPREQVSRSRQMAVFKAYCGVAKLGPTEKRLARRVLRKLRFMQRKLGPYR